MDFLSDDVVHNFTTRDTMLMNGAVPWRGAREKDPALLRLLIEATTKAGDVVFDYNASTGTLYLLSIFCLFLLLIFYFYITYTYRISHVQVHQLRPASLVDAIFWLWRVTRQFLMPC